MSLFADEAIVASVYFHAGSTSTTGLASEGTAENEDGMVIASLDGDGVLRWTPSQCGSIMIADGTTVRGFQMVNSLGVDMSAADVDALVQPATSRRLGMLMLHAPVGGSFTITHQDAAVAAEQRATTPYSASVVYGSDRIQVFYETRGNARTWRVPDWAGYIPAQSTDWLDAPTRLTQWAALDELATRAPRRKLGTTAITTGVPATVWSETVAEGTTLAGELTVRASFDSAGTIQHTYVKAAFSASRSVGGSPVLTLLSTPQEEGTIPLGSADVVVNGNDIELQVTYSVTGTITWVRTDTTEVLIP